MWNGYDRRLFGGSPDDKRKLNEKEKAAKTIQSAWWIHVKTRLFKLLKHTIRAAEHCISYDILRKAAVDACRLMGYRKYYKQILQDELQFKRYGVTDEIDVATVKDYLQYSSHLDETPAYFGGRHNYWRRLSLENFPRTMIMYDIMDYAQCGKMSARLRCELPFLLLRPDNEETYHAQLMAICQIRFVTPQPTTVRSLGLDRRSAPRSQRRSYQAQQKIAKMRKAYKLEKGKMEQQTDISAPLTSHQEATVPLQKGRDYQTLFVEEEWEKEAAKLFAWSKSLGEDTENDLH